MAGNSTYVDFKKISICFIMYFIYDPNVTVESLVSLFGRV